MIKRIIIAILIAHFITAAYGLLWLFGADYAAEPVNYFLDKSIAPMARAWYYKFMSEYILHCVTYICFAAVSWHYSRKLFLVVGLLNIYHLIDFIMFMVNFNQSWWLYIALGALVIGGVIVACLPVKDTGRVVKM